MVYDGARQVSILFGGRQRSADNNDQTDLGDTWQWDGEAWTQLANSGPSPRSGHGMAFDSGRNRTVLFGSFRTDQPPPIADTWEFDGQDWTQQADTGPPAAGPMAFDSIGARVLLFDGQSVTTWSWNGASWVQIAAFGPPTRTGAAMTAAAGSIMLFGGRTFVAKFGDSWSFDGIHWTQVQDIGPSPRGAHALTFDSTRGAVVLFGGQDANAVLGDTWEHNT